MGIMSSITGNAGPMDVGAAASEYGRLLAQGEVIQAAFQFVRDALAWVLPFVPIIEIAFPGHTAPRMSHRSSGWCPPVV